MSMLRYAILAGGGTALGASQVPVFERLIATRGLPVAMGGTSIGANNVSKSGQGAKGVRDLKRVWNRVDGTGFFQRPRADFWNGAFSLNKLRKLHDQMDSCTDLRCEVLVGVYDLATQEHRMQCLNDLQNVSDRRDAVIASSQQPMIHHHERLEGRWVADGGVYSVLGHLPDHILGDIDELHVMACSPVHWEQRRRLRSQREVAQAIEQGAVCFETWMTMIAARDYLWLREVAREIPVWLYAPASWDQVGKPFDAEPEDIKKRLKLGRQLAANPVAVPPAEGLSCSQLDRVLQILAEAGADPDEVMRELRTCA